MFRLYKAAIMKPFVSEMYKQYYISIAVHLKKKTMAEISPLHEVFVNIMYAKHFYNT